MLIAGGALMVVAALAGGAKSGGDAKSGGTFRIVYEGIDFVDPALSYSFQGAALLDAACARLMTYPDHPAPRGWRLVPEVATSYPRVSRPRGSRLRAQLLRGCGRRRFPQSASPMS
jgi:hypothetical protein